MKLFEKKIPSKNYIKLLIICLLTLGAAILLRSWYISHLEYEKTIPVIDGIISEIKYNEFDTYITENLDAVIYIGASEDINCREVEAKFKNYIITNELREEIIYLNISDSDNRKSVISEINANYVDNQSRITIGSYPALIIFKNGKIYDAVSKQGYNQLTFGEMARLLEEYEVGKS